MITVIQIHQGGLMIGELSKDLITMELILTAPRVIQMQQTGPGQVNIQFLVMLGNPKEIRIRGQAVIIQYVPDDELATSYREEVTGPTPAKTLPGGNVLLFPGRKN